MSVKREAPMKTISQQLTQYASYHRDRRNIATHFVGIPLIVVAVAALLSRPALVVAGVTLSPAVLAIVGSVIFYLRMELRFALVMAALMGLAGFAAAHMAAMSTGAWLTSSITMFVVGWAFQFVGHFFEGKKPAFVDDIAGFLVGPLFVVAELGFALGLRKELHDEIVRGAGPTRARTERTAAAA